MPPSNPSQAITPPWWDVFASEYIRTGKKRDSYLAAKPDAKPHSAEQLASRLLRKVKFIAHLNGIKAESAKKFNLSKDEWLAMISEMAIGAESEVVRLRAREILGKALGHYTDKVQVSGSIGLTFNSEIQDQISQDFERLRNEHPIFGGAQ